MGTLPFTRAYQITKTYDKSGKEEILGYYSSMLKVSMYLHSIRDNAVRKNIKYDLNFDDTKLHIDQDGCTEGYTLTVKWVKTNPKILAKMLLG